MMKNRVALVAGLAAGMAAPALAQSNEAAPPRARAAQVIPLNGVADALGEVKFGPVNIEGAVSPVDNGILGVVHAFNHFWISGRATATATSHKIYKFDTNGTLVNSYTQTSANAAWGGRDGAADEANNKLYFGEENSRINEYTYNPGTGDIAFTQAINIGPVFTAAGLATTNIVRALAFNPNNGHFYTSNFGTTGIIEFTLNPPTYIRTMPSTTPNYGAGYADDTDTLWIWHQGDLACGGVVAVEYELVGGTPTGRTFNGALIPPTCLPPTQNLAGGCDVYCGDPHNPGFLSFVGMHQATPDSLVVYDLADACGAGGCYPDCNGDTQLTVADFGCFQTRFVQGDPYADCNGDTQLTVADFGCFQTKFVQGCN